MVEQRRVGFIPVIGRRATSWVASGGAEWERTNGAHGRTRTCGLRFRRATQSTTGRNRSYPVSLVLQVITVNGRNRS